MDYLKVVSDWFSSPPLKKKSVDEEWASFAATDDDYVNVAVPKVRRAQYKIVNRFLLSYMPKLVTHMTSLRAQIHSLADRDILPQEYATEVNAIVENAVTVYQKQLVPKLRKILPTINEESWGKKTEAITNEKLGPLKAMLDEFAATSEVKKALFNNDCFRYAYKSYETMRKDLLAFLAEVDDEIKEYTPQRLTYPSLGPLLAKLQTGAEELRQAYESYKNFIQFNCTDTPSVDIAMKDLVDMQDALQLVRNRLYIITKPSSSASVRRRRATPISPNSKPSYTFRK